MSVYYPLEILASFLAVVVVLTLHEFSHAFAAYKCGDPTPKWNRRLTLNPLRHFDLLGLLCFTFVGFGWAKPVPINANNFKHYRKGMALTASAGIITNYISAFLLYPIFLVVFYYARPAMQNVYFLYYFLYYLTYFLYAYSLAFCVFNLLPLYPLDGFRIVDALNRRRGKVYQFLRNYGHYILLGLIIESFICNMFVRFGVWQMDWFNVLGWIMKFATDIFGWPITALWGLIPW